MPKKTRPDPAPKDMTEYDLRGIRADLADLQQRVKALEQRTPGAGPDPRYQMPETDPEGDLGED